MAVGSVRQGDRGAAPRCKRIVESGDVKALVISPRTAGQHVQHIYGRICVATQAAAAMSAMQQGAP